MVAPTGQCGPRLSPVSRNSDGRLELFYTTSTGALNHSWQLAPNGSWSGGSGF